VNVDSIRFIPFLATAVLTVLPPPANGHSKKPIVAIVPAIKGKNADESSRFDIASDAASVRSRTNRPPMRVARAIQRCSIPKKLAAIDLVVTNSFILPPALP
jgi:hypothetical protein